MVIQLLMALPEEHKMGAAGSGYMSTCANILVPKVVNQILEIPDLPWACPHQKHLVVAQPPHTVHSTTHFGNL